MRPLLALVAAARHRPSRWPSRTSADLVMKGEVPSTSASPPGKSRRTEKQAERARTFICHTLEAVQSPNCCFVGEGEKADPLPQCEELLWRAGGELLFEGYPTVVDVRHHIVHEPDRVEALGVGGSIVSSEP